MQIAPALRHRNFRLLWLGMLISVSGSMMQNAAILWHVYEVTASPIALGIVGLSKVVPIIGLSLFSGMIADSFDRRKVMLAAQSGMALCAFALAVVAKYQIDSPLPIYLLAAFSAAFSAFDLPARQALVPALVHRDDLTNAFSLNSIMFQTASILGPVMFGMVIGPLGLESAYWLNGLSYLAVIVALVAMNVPKHTVAVGRPAVSVSAALEGLNFVRNTPIILSSMLLDFFATFFSSAQALLPIYAKDILRVGASGYGWLFAASAVGALIMGGYLALVRLNGREGTILIVSVLIFGLATVLFGLAKTFLPAFIALAATGAADTISTVIRNTIRQLNTPDHIRGRMVSVNMIFFMGGPQLGELEAGLVASWFGAPVSVISGGVACVLAAVWIARRFPTLWRYDSKVHQPAIADLAIAKAPAAD